MIFVSAEGFQTDAQISGGASSGLNGEMRELEKWEPDAGEDFEVDMQLDKTENGWKAEDMFMVNKRDYDVGSTYKDNLEGYTTQLKEKESDEYR